MNPAMNSAFSAASGYPAASMGIGIALVVAAVLLVWGTNSVRALLGELMARPSLFGKNMRLVIRVLAIVMSFLYFLS